MWASATSPKPAVSVESFLKQSMTADLAPSVGQVHGLAGGAEALGRFRPSTGREVDVLAVDLVDHDRQRQVDLAGPP